MSIPRVMLNAAVPVLFCMLSIAYAQQTSTQEKIPGQPVAEETVQSGEVVAVDGNDVFLRREDGQVKHYVVPPDFKFTVDGKEIGVSELQPGTKLSQTITTTKTPQTVRTVTTIKGRVWHVNPPNVLILNMPDGTIKEYHIPKGQKFNVHGEQMDAFALKKGMNIDATVVRETPEEVVSVAKGQIKGMVPAAEPVHMAQAQEPPPAPTAATTEPAKTEKLPQTATPLPLFGLLGIASICGSILLKRCRIL